MSYLIKVGASRLKQCLNFFKMGALKYTMGFMKTSYL
jgi:hypothetical protein